ncbi:MAG TPA: DUF432 domain-containing protein [Firmicutes bacterium]|nr:MAG: hypothetical protein DRH49_05180 [Candidatus Coatesbacteria bacterium]RLC44019.1 MAG: hypothetical protein DRH44_03660 [Candidatus Coatesbacteria bacterium]HDM43231.1 DUF432 domain-containing protein [Bacillota bacterium]
MAELYGIYNSEIVVELENGKTFDFRVLDNRYLVEPIKGGLFNIRCEDREIFDVIVSHSNKARILIKPRALDIPVLTRLSREVVISEKGRVSGYCKVPISIAMYVMLGNDRYLVDEIKPELRKLLYGPPTEEGEIVYLYNSDWQTEPFDELSSFEAMMLTEIQNTQSIPSKFSCFKMVPAHIQFYLKEETVYTNRTKIVLVKGEECEIEYTPDPSVVGGELIEDMQEKPVKAMITNSFKLNIGKAKE